MKDPVIYIVIPVFNRKQFTRDCLLSLRKQTHQGFKVVVVDDGSTDGTPEMLEEEFPEVIVIRGDGNLWWTKATNLGIERALEEKADYVLTLNNDTYATETYIEKLVYWAQRKPEALQGSFALDFESKEAVYGGTLFHWTKSSVDLLGQLKEDERQGLHKMSMYPGRGLLIPASVFDKIGLFDEEKFPHYYADLDFTYLAHRKGCEMYCNYDALLYTYPDEGGDRKLRSSKNLKNYYNHLFGIKGGGNLKNYTNFVFKHCPPIYQPYVLLNGYTRRIVGYLLK